MLTYIVMTIWIVLFIRSFPVAPLLTWFMMRYTVCFFSQDGCQRNDSLWSFFVYDVYGRVVVEGECGNSDKHVRTAGETVVLGTLMEGDTGLAYSGYQSSFDLVDPCVYVVNYYDTYDFRTRNGFSAYNFPEGTVSAIGNLTGSIFCTHGSSGVHLFCGLL